MSSIILWITLLIAASANVWALEKPNLQKAPDFDIGLINLAWKQNGHDSLEFQQPANTSFQEFYALTPGEQKTQKIEALSEDKINTARWWTILAGFGIGHSMCGHWMPLSRGWIYTLIDLDLLLGPPIMGIMNMGSFYLQTGAAGASGSSYTSSDDMENIIFLATWGALFIIARVIQVIDFNATVDAHNKT
ncbi:MAG: hypothetical protein JXR70_18835 [Spirochaetales bacterium]|nr:hypothetical protein [Spirochaetales bacterium]